MTPDARAALRRYLHTIQGGRCAYCETSPGYELHLEHLVPVSRGGSDDICNIVAACSPCNSSKRSLTALEYFLWKYGRERIYVDGFGWAEVIPPRPRIALRQAA